MTIASGASLRLNYPKTRQNRTDPGSNPCSVDQNSNSTKVKNPNSGSDLQTIQQNVFDSGTQVNSMKKVHQEGSVVAAAEVKYPSLISCCGTMVDWPLHTITVVLGSYPAIIIFIFLFLLLPFIIKIARLITQIIE